MRRPFNQFEPFEFKTLDGFNARVIPALSVEKPVAFLTLKWTEGPLIHTWVGELTPEMTNWAVHPGHAWVLDGSLSTHVQGERGRERIPATFRLLVDLKTWARVVVELHRAWDGRGTPPTRAKQFNGTEDAATAQLYYRAIDWVRREVALGRSVPQLKKMVKQDARNPTGPDPEDIRTRTAIVFYFEKGKTLDEVEAEVAKVYGPRAS